jgi:hypothetical protein
MKSQTISKGTGSSHLPGLMSFLMVALTASIAFALDPMGPPIGMNGQGVATAGIDYSYSDIELELNNGCWVEYLDGAFFDSGEAVSLNVKDFRRNKVYANLGFGLVDNLDLFVRLGVANATFGDSIWGDGEKFDSKAEPAVGFGIRATFYENENFAIGTLVQTSWARFDGQLTSPYWAASDFVEVSMAEVQIAIGTTVKLSDEVAVYGGPFFHFVDGALDDEFYEAAEGGLIRAEYSWDFKESSNFGGYIGAAFELGKNISFNVEYQRTSTADAVAAAIAWRF